MQIHASTAETTAEQRAASLARLRADRLRAFGVGDGFVPDVTNPAAHRAHLHTREWARGHGLLVGARQVRTFDHVAYTALFARGCVDADADRLALFARWFTLLFIVDDLQDDAVFQGRQEGFRELQEEYLRVLRGRSDRPRPSGSALLDAVADLAATTRPLVSAAWWSRFTDDLGRTFVSQRVENGCREQGTALAPEEFAVVRREASTTDVCFDLIEACLEAEVTEAFRDSPACRRYTETLSEFTTWTNDVFGVDRDADNGDPNNYVLVLQAAGGTDRATALERATADVSDLVARLPRLRVDALATAGELARDEDELRAAHRAVAGWWNFSLNVPGFYLAVGSRLEHMNNVPDGRSSGLTPDLLPGVQPGAQRDGRAATGASAPA